MFLPYHDKIQGEGTRLHGGPTWKDVFRVQWSTSSQKKCDFVGCRDQQSPTATMEYWFPWWFVSMNMQLHFKYIANVGPQFQISMVRRVPDTSQSVVFAQQGNIDGLKFLFTQGLASPRDVSDSRGFSLMRVRWPRGFFFPSRLLIHVSGLCMPVCTAMRLSSFSSAKERQLMKCKFCFSHYVYMGFAHHVKHL
jgi:hypothetical protein